MLQLQFLFVNAHFTLNLLTALVCFAVAWLYFDAWLGRKDIKEGTKSLGFALLSVTFVLHSISVESSYLSSTIGTLPFISGLSHFFKIAGYIILLLGQAIDPLQPLPSYRGSKSGFGVVNQKSKAKQILILGSIPLSASLPFAFPFLSATTAFLYIRRATMGLEFHLRTIGYSFFLLTVSEVFGLAELFRGSSNITVENIVSPFGPLWMIEHLMLILFVVLLGRWVWYYLAKRLETQLFMIFNIVVLSVFLITAVFFTSVSFSNLRTGILESLKTNAAVLQFALDGKKAEVLSNAEVLAQSNDIATALLDKDRDALIDISAKAVISKNQDILVVVDDRGAIIARADDPEKAGGSLSNDPLVKKSLEGESASAIVTRDGVLAPTVSVRASVPIHSGDEIIGAVMSGSTIDNAFIDGLKNATGLDASIYANNIRSATTFVAPDGKSRWVGIQEETFEIKDKVLTNSETYMGSVSILNVPYLSAFTPLIGPEDRPIGMLFVGIPEIFTLEAAGNLIEKTFLVTVILLVISVIPTYFVSKYIIGQIH